MTLLSTLQRLSMPDASLVVLPQLRHTVVPNESAPDRLGIVAFMGASERKGSWSLPRNLRIVAVMGAAEIDLREARIPEGGCDIEIFCFMAAVELIVPPGVRVESSGSTLGGIVELSMDGASEPREDAPRIRVKGDVFFGSVETVVRYPGESGSAAKKRIRRSRK